MLKKIRNTRWTMRQKLLFYMLVLAGLLLFSLFSSILFLDRFESAEKSISKTLDFQMEVFEKDMSAYFESLAANSIDLSRYLSEYIDRNNAISGYRFESLTDDPEKIDQLQTDLLPHLEQKLQNQSCSGIFVMLEATVNSQVEDAALSRTGLYLQHNRYLNDGNVILFRGNSTVGKAQGIMPHRKWRLEFRVDQFPNYDDLASIADSPLNEAYMLTKCTTLNGTSDDVVLMAVPIVGKDGTYYGICGYEVSAEYFMTYHAQPAAEGSLACVLLTGDRTHGYVSAGLCCSGHDNHVQPPVGSVTMQNMTGNLTSISDAGQSFVGVCKTITLSPNNPDFTLAVMIPEADYNRIVIKSWVQVAILVILLLFFAVSCCIYFTTRYLSPILRGLEQIKKSDWETVPSSIPEINDLFDYLAKQDEAHSSAISAVKTKLAEATGRYQEAQKQYGDAQAELEQAQIELHRLSYSRKTEVDPEMYAAFVSGLKTLTPTEISILDYYMEGKSVKEIMEITGVKESTIRFHNRNIYSKLNVNSLKQLLRYASMIKHAEED